MLAVAVTAAGCSINGSWKTVALDPPGAPFALKTISFDRDHHYTATWLQEGRNRTGVGRYEWNGTNLLVMPPGRRPRSYGARLRLDGKMVMTFKQGDNKVAATLARLDG